MYKEKKERKEKVFFLVVKSWDQLFLWINLFILCLHAAPGLSLGTASRGSSLRLVHELLIAVASPRVPQALGAWASAVLTHWLSRPKACRILADHVSSLAGGCSTTEPAGKPGANSVVIMRLCLTSLGLMYLTAKFLPFDYLHPTPPSSPLPSNHKSNHSFC